MNATQIVNDYLDAFAAGRDPSGFLSDDFSFDGPLLRAESKAEFLQGIAAMGPMKPRFEVLKQFAQGDDVCTIYNFLINDAKVLMSEVSTVRASKIAAQTLVYDTVAFKAATGG